MRIAVCVDVTGAPGAGLEVEHRVPLPYLVGLDQKVAADYPPMLRPWIVYTDTPAKC